MDKVVIDDKTFVPYITNDKIQARIKEVAAEIKKDCESKNPLFVCVLNGFHQVQALLRNAIDWFGKATARTRPGHLRTHNRDCRGYRRHWLHRPAARCRTEKAEPCRNPFRHIAAQAFRCKSRCQRRLLLLRDSDQIHHRLRTRP